MQDTAFPASDGVVIGGFPFLCPTCRFSVVQESIERTSCRPRAHFSTHENIPTTMPLDNIESYAKDGTAADKESTWNYPEKSDG
tara:strand:+ start:10471 stop:10722 length:252 start_codon:yes stop_codon:yes gene_type:complete